jgi:hypothetical protein
LGLPLDSTSISLDFLAILQNREDIALFAIAAPFPYALTIYQAWKIKKSSQDVS